MESQWNVTFSKLGHRLISSKPYLDCSELNGGEEVVVTFVISGSDGPEVFEFVSLVTNGILHVDGTKYRSSPSTCRKGAGDMAAMAPVAAALYRAALGLWQPRGVYVFISHGNGDQWRVRENAGRLATTCLPRAAWAGS